MTSRSFVLLAFALIQAPVSGASPDTDEAILRQLEAGWNATHPRGDAVALMWLSPVK